MNKELEALMAYFQDRPNMERMFSELTASNHPVWGTCP